MDTPKSRSGWSIYVIIFCLFMFFAISWGNASEESIIHAVIFHEVSPINLNGPCVSPDFLRDVLRAIEIGGKQTVLLSKKHLL